MGIVTGLGGLGTYLNSICGYKWLLRKKHVPDEADTRSLNLPFVNETRGTACKSLENMRVCTPHVRPLTLFLRPPPRYQRRRAVDTHRSPPPCLLRRRHIMDLNITSYLPSLHKIERGVGDFPPPITSVSPSPLPGLLAVIFHSAFALNESISFD